MTHALGDGFQVSTALLASQRPYVFKLLQSTSREPDSPFAIEREYPIVLGQAMAAASVCLTKAPFTASADLICHSSLWPRRLVGAGGEFRVGLIGNVATHPDWRNRGLMTKLLAEVSARAVAEGLSALILWSELTGLYERLGFVPTGKELRYTFHRERLIAKLTMAEIAAGYNLKAVAASELSDADLGRCLALRPLAPFTLHRGVTEFRQLLTIPNLKIFVRRDEASGELASFYLVDKGVDMPQVIHEWGFLRPADSGASAPRQLAAELFVIGEALGYEQFLLLAPGQLDTACPELSRLCAELVIAAESHPMALIKLLSDQRAVRQALAEAFVWGLDGI